MNTFAFQRSELKGTVALPSSKSQSLRALLFAALADGPSTLTNLLPSPDSECMIEAIKKLGARVEGGYDRMVVTPGVALEDRVIDAGNSGIILRFVGACATLFPGITAITGDESIRKRRPVQPLIHALRLFGASALGAKNDTGAPLYVSGAMRGGNARIDGIDSQPVSGLLIACALSQGEYTLSVDNPKEAPWIDVTLEWLHRFGIEIQHESYSRYVISGGNKVPSFSYNVPGDLSTLLFPVAAALITGSPLSVTNVDLQETQGDKVVLDFLRSCGAQITVDGDVLSITPSTLHGGDFDLNLSIDSLPILAVIGTTMQTPLRLYNGYVARLKESDRITAMCISLKKMGAQIEEKEDGMIIYPTRLTGHTLFSYNDHRIAMSLLIAGMIADKKTTVTGCECIAKTYPTFFQDMKTLGANAERI